MHIVVTLGELIVLGIIALIIVISIIIAIFESISNLFKKNCYKCKYWKLDGVAGSGGIAYYRCDKGNLNHKVTQDFNEDAHYEKCDKFENS